MEVDQDASARHVDLDMSLPRLYYVKHGVRLGLRQFEAHREAWHRPGDAQGTAANILRREMSMQKKQVGIPKFRTEAEEANWWDRHPEAATGIMKRALKSGKARRAVPLKTVTMRLPVPDIMAAQDLAHEKGLPYQTYIKMLLHEALKKERSAGSTRN